MGVVLEMDNRGFQKEPEREIRIPMRETGTATVGPPQPSTSTSTNTSNVSKGTGAVVCRPEVCRRARAKYTRTRETSESPWHRRKTIMLVGIVILLAAWAVVYGVLSNKGVL